MFKNKSLAFKHSFYILTCTLIIFMFIFIHNAIVSRKLMLANLEENSKNLANATANRIDQVFMVSETVAKGLAIMLENCPANVREIKRLQTEILSANPDIFGICVAFEPYKFRKSQKLYAPYACRGKNGKFDFSNLNNEEYRYPLQDWYQVSAITRKIIWSEPYYDEGGGNIIMSTCSVPFYRKERGKRIFTGVVTADISLTWLQKMIKSIKIMNHGYGFLISKHGTLVTYPDINKIMNESIFSMADEANDPDLRKIGRKMINGDSSFIPYKCRIFGHKSWMYYTPLASNNWSLAVVFPENELFAKLNRLNNAIMILSVIGLVILFVIIILISHKVTKPLREFAVITEDIGSGNFNRQLPDINGNDEIGKLNRAFGAMQKALAQYIENLKKTTAAKEKIESELKIARDIQLGIIPKMFPAFPERPEFDIYALLVSAREVGGDLYNFFFIDEDHLFFSIGDVSGKGIPASLFMAVTQTLSRARSDKNMAPGAILTRMNQDLCRDNEMSMFVTYFAGILNIKTGKLHISNAGHNPPFIINPEKEITGLRDKHGIPLGVMDLEPYKSAEITIQPGDSIVMYTDGVTEAMNINNEEFGEPRLLEILNANRKLDAENLTKLLLKEVKTFAGEQEQSDDITILVLAYNGPDIKKSC